MLLIAKTVLSKAPLLLKVDVTASDGEGIAAYPKKWPNLEETT
jgi:hypothetical protein